MSAAERRAPDGGEDPRARATLERTRRLARLLDSRFRVPGTRLRFGLDPLLGLVPGVGDLVSAALSLDTLLAARRLDVPRGIQGRMVMNLAADLLLGSLPLVGDLFDFVFRANRRNLALLERHLAKRAGSDVDHSRPDTASAPRLTRP